MHTMVHLEKNYVTKGLILLYQQLILVVLLAVSTGCVSYRIVLHAKVETKAAADDRQSKVDPVATLAEEIGADYKVYSTSPHCNERRFKDPVTRQQQGTTQKPSILVIHYTAGEVERAHQYFTRNTILSWQGIQTLLSTWRIDTIVHRRREVSAHYLITRKGSIRRYVPERLRAWHAGRGAWSPPSAPSLFKCFKCYF